MSVLKKFSAEYNGREVKLNKPTKGDTKKYKVYVKDPKTDNVKKVEFGDPNLEIKRDDPERRKNFRSRHKCDSDPKAKDKTRPKYWSCRFWEGGKSVTELLNKKSSVFKELADAAEELHRMKNSGVAHIRGKGIDWEECEKMIGKYKNYKSVNVQPYDDADVVYTNNKVSVWVYCKPDEIQVIIFNYPLTKKVEDFGDDDLDEMHSKWNKELKVRFKKDSSTEEVVDWFKHILDKYA